MSDIRIKLSAGLIVFAVIHALAMIGGFLAIHEMPAHLHAERAAIQPLPIPTADSYTQPGLSTLPQPTVTAPPVNRSALDEIKQQQPTRGIRTGGRWVYNPNTGESTWCNDCGVPIVNVPPVRPAPVQPYRTPTPAPALPAANTGPVIVPASGGSILAGGNQLPPPKQYELALFVGTDARSQQLLQWFNTDPTLRQVKAISNYQVYTRDSPLYQSRYINVVRPEHFPAVVLQHPDGAHIHAAGGSFLPTNPQQLFADMKQGVQYSRQVRETDRQMTGMIRTAGYSWDRAINPQMTLAPAGMITQDSTGSDCVDGNCLPGNRTPRRPLDNLFDGAKDNAQAILWAGGNEIVVVILALGVVGVIVMLLRKLSQP